MNANEVLDELKALGSDSYKSLLMRNHGVREPCYGVKIGDVKPLQKRIKKDYQLALDLYDSGVYDAMYFAGLIADDERMSKKDLNHWVRTAQGGALLGSTVPWVAAGSRHGWELALEWIDSKQSSIAAAGWATLASLVSIKDDAELDIARLKELLKHVQQSIHQAEDSVRYQMNGFVIAAGCYVAPLKEDAIKVAEKIGPVTANLGNNNCQVPYAPDYIRKVESMGRIGKKRKTAKC